MQGIANRKVIVLIVLAFLLTAGLASRKNSSPQNQNYAGFEMDDEARLETKLFGGPQGSAQYISTAARRTETYAAPVRGPASTATPYNTNSQGQGPSKETAASQLKNSGFRPRQIVQLPQRHLTFDSNMSDGNKRSYVSGYINFSEQLSYQLMVYLYDDHARIYAMFDNGPSELQNLQFVTDSNANQFLYVSTKNCDPSLSEFVTAILIEIPKQPGDDINFWIQKKFSREWSKPRDGTDTSNWGEASSALQPSYGVCT